MLNTIIGYEDLYIAEYDAGGNALWAIGAGGQDRDIGMGIYAGAGGDVYVTGYFGSYSLSFGNNTITNNGSYDMYLSKSGINVGIDVNNTSALSVYPNPFTDVVNITLPDNTVSEIVIYDIATREIRRQEVINHASLNMEHVVNGIYFYEVRNANGIWRNGKIVKY